MKGITATAKRMEKTSQRQVIMNTKEVAQVLGRAPRTVRRYAQYKQVIAAYKSPRKGWQFITLVNLTVG